MHLSCMSTQLRSICRWKQFMRKELPCCDPRRSMAGTQFLQPFGQSHSLFHAPHSIEFTKGLSLLKMSTQNKAALLLPLKFLIPGHELGSKCLVLPANWMRALCLYPFHRWSMYSCVVTAQGGGRFWKIHTVKIAVHSAECCSTATTMALTSSK